jgi:hypothetical protein
MAGTQAQQVFGAGIQVGDDAVGINADDGCREAAKDVSGQRCRR